jgi:hypothetical protein
VKFSKATKLSAIIMTFVLVLGLVACSADKTEKKKSNVDIKTLMAQEPNDADEAAKLYDKLLQAENDILSNNSALWEKVFLSANKNTPMIEDGTNYGDFLLSTVEGSKSDFSADEYKILKAAAEQIKEIEGKLTILEQKYPGCGKKPSSGECVDAASAGMAGDASKLMKFPSFNGKDLDGNDVNSSDLFSGNTVTVVNFWFTSCKANTSGCSFAMKSTKISRFASCSGMIRLWVFNVNSFIAFYRISLMSDFRTSALGPYTA